MAVKVVEAAQQIGISEGRVRQLILAGELRAEKRGRGWDVSPAEVDRQKTLRSGGNVKVGKRSDIPEPKDELATFTLEDVGVKETELIDLLLLIQHLEWKYWSKAIISVTAIRGVRIKDELLAKIAEARSEQNMKFQGAPIFSSHRPLTNSLALEVNVKKPMSGRRRQLSSDQAQLFDGQDEWRYNREE